MRSTLPQSVKEFCDLVENGWFEEAESYIKLGSPERTEILEWERDGGFKRATRESRKSSQYREFEKYSFNMPIDLEH